ncbi:hypothetical protein Htur_4699 (plasmid) [Haloterrigena turkmenica DSM 5511]|uniref:Uncharacterized protein n=1 Tax=Haloterrigena turkmenica (strain ATCC 51198 / DSM 5511 / JCM 9101 / NCIMB 13204 / VKM B-1734 / 4k) TaxID=543526 RepID=D2S280_HALTV|nr:hypothetical protein Htur_4699 [Haloterrigena turkmenica DSM 5511]
MGRLPKRQQCAPPPLPLFPPSGTHSIHESPRQTRCPRPGHTTRDTGRLVSTGRNRRPRSRRDRSRRPYARSRDARGDRTRGRRDRTDGTLVPARPPADARGRGNRPLRLRTGTGRVAGKRTENRLRTLLPESLRSSFSRRPASVVNAARHRLGERSIPVIESLSSRAFSPDRSSTYNRVQYHRSTVFRPRCVIGNV